MKTTENEWGTYNVHYRDEGTNPPFGPKRNLFDELMEGLPHGKWAIWREGFNPCFGPMQPVTEGEHAMVTIDCPFTGSQKAIDEGD